jgi:hypothetical protein
VAFGGCCCALLPEEDAVVEDAIVFPSISDSYDKNIVSSCELIIIISEQYRNMRRSN